MHQLLKQGTDLFPDGLIAAGEDKVGLEPVGGVADVVTFGGEDHPMHGLALAEEFEGIGELDLATLAGGGLVEALEDVGRQDIAGTDGKPAGGVLRPGLLDEGADAEDAGLHLIAADDAIAGDLFGRHFLQADDGRSILLVCPGHLGQGQLLAGEDGIAQQAGEGFIADMASGLGDGVAEAALLGLAG